MQFTTTVDEACNLLNRTERTLRLWRDTGIGPLWTRTRKPDHTGHLRLPGPDVLYNRESVLEWQHKTKAQISAEMPQKFSVDTTPPEREVPPPTHEQARDALAKLLGTVNIKTMPQPYGYGHGAQRQTQPREKSWQERQQELLQNSAYYAQKSSS